MPEDDVAQPVGFEWLHILVDVAVPDLAAPDLAAPDLAAPDLAAPDLAAPVVPAPYLHQPALPAPDLNDPQNVLAAETVSKLHAGADGYKSKRKIAKARRGDKAKELVSGDVIPACELKITDAMVRRATPCCQWYYQCLCKCCGRCCSHCDCKLLTVILKTHLRCQSDVLRRKSKLPDELLILRKDISKRASRLNDVESEMKELKDEYRELVRQYLIIDPDNVLIKGRKNAMLEALRRKNKSIHTICLSYQVQELMLSFEYLTNQLHTENPNPKSRTNAGGSTFADSANKTSVDGAEITDKLLVFATACCTFFFECFCRSCNNCCWHCDCDWKNVKLNTNLRCLDFNTNKSESSDDKEKGDLLTYLKRDSRVVASEVDLKEDMKVKRDEFIKQVREYVNFEKDNKSNKSEQVETKRTSLKEGLRRKSSSIHTIWLAYEKQQLLKDIESLEEKIDAKAADSKPEGAEGNATEVGLGLFQDC